MSRLLAVAIVVGLTAAGTLFSCDHADMSAKAPTTADDQAAEDAAAAVSTPTPEGAVPKSTPTPSATPEGGPDATTTRLRIAPAEAHLEVGQSITLIAYEETVSGGVVTEQRNVTASAVWTTQQPAVATVASGDETGDGVVKAVGAGTTQVVAMANGETNAITLEVSSNSGVAADGGWTPYGPFGPCSVTCGSGTQTASRSCANPLPANGGTDCDGAADESQTCNTQACPTPTPTAKPSVTPPVPTPPAPTPPAPTPPTPPAPTPPTPPAPTPPTPPAPTPPAPTPPAPTPPAPPAPPPPAPMPPTPMPPAPQPPAPTPTPPPTVVTGALCIGGPSCNISYLADSPADAQTCMAVANSQDCANDPKCGAGYKLQVCNCTCSDSAGLTFDSPSTCRRFNPEKPGAKSAVPYCKSH